MSAVRASARLATSAVCLVAPDLGPDRQLEKILSAHEKLKTQSAPILELNPGHALIKALAAKATAGGAGRRSTMRPSSSSARRASSTARRRTTRPTTQPGSAGSSSTRSASADPSVKGPLERTRSDRAMPVERLLIGVLTPSLILPFRQGARLWEFAPVAPVGNGVRGPGPFRIGPISLTRLTRTSSGSIRPLPAGERCSAATNSFPA